MIFRGWVDDHSLLNVDDPGRWAGHLQSLKGRVVEVTLKRASQKRSLKQNSYYWGLMQIVADFLNASRRTEPGEVYEEVSKDEASWLFRKEILGFEDTRLGPVPRHTRNLTTDQFSEYIEQIMARCAGWGLKLPSAEEWAEYGKGQA